jgi:isocitrate dehydrogenase kinase/phosphatase
VSPDGGGVRFKHLIAQPKMIPLPVFLETAAPADARTAIVNLGNCIKNNAAANIFNKDLDGRNYGVSRFLKVFLFDYDAVETLTAVKVRTNRDRFEGEEDIPDWFFEDGVIFLPEEMEVGLRIQDRSLSRLFREVHGDLLTTAYWERMQDALRNGRVPRINIYPEARRLRSEATPTRRPISESSP